MIYAKVWTLDNARARRNEVKDEGMKKRKKREEEEARCKYLLMLSQSIISTFLRLRLLQLLAVCCNVHANYGSTVAKVAIQAGYYFICAVIYLIIILHFVAFINSTAVYVEISLSVFDLI